MRPTLTVASLVTLALLIFAAVQDNFLNSWQTHQRAFRRLLIERAADDDQRVLAERFQVEIRQIVVPDLGSVDRCVSCHFGYDDPRMKDAPLPFRLHPRDLLDQHDVDGFGCTACHWGQGRATTKREAHADEDEVFWERALLPPPFVESACARCHDPEYLAERGAPVLARGAALFRDLGCRGCHKLGGRGGRHGPELDLVGDKVPHALPFAHVDGPRYPWVWHRAHLRAPQQVVPGSKMPPVSGDAEIESLTTFLLSLRTGNLNERLIPDDKYEQRYRALHPAPLPGAELYRQFCSACHEDGTETVLHDTLPQAVPSIRNPSFLAVVDEEWLLHTVRDGRVGTEMPAWGSAGGGLSEDEMRSVVGYLLEARTETRDLAFTPAASADAEAGGKLFEANCAECHAVAAGAEACCTWLGSPGFQAAYSDALMGHTIKFGREGTLMNPYGVEADGDLTDQDVSDLVAFIRTLK